MHSVDERMVAFVAWNGTVPKEAVRIEDYEARDHLSRWISHNLGRGIVHSYVIGYRLRERWWTLFFERLPDSDTAEAERWWVEGYDHTGNSWGDEYLYLTDETRWESSQYGGSRPGGSAPNAGPADPPP